MKTITPIAALGLALAGALSPAAAQYYGDRDYGGAAPPPGSSGSTRFATDRWQRPSAVSGAGETVAALAAHIADAELACAQR